MIGDFSERTLLFFRRWHLIIKIKNHFNIQNLFHTFQNNKNNVIKIKNRFNIENLFHIFQNNKNNVNIMLLNKSLFFL